jgi:hypothetical protein
MEGSSFRSPFFMPPRYELYDGSKPWTSIVFPIRDVPRRLGVSRLEFQEIVARGEIKILEISTRRRGRFRGVRVEAVFEYIDRCRSQALLALDTEKSDKGGA